MRQGVVSAVLDCKSTSQEEIMKFSTDVLASDISELEKLAGELND